jgi:hypothetical protein
MAISLPSVEQRRFTKVTTTTTTVVDHGEDDEDAAYWPLLDGDDSGAPPAFVPPPDFPQLSHIDFAQLLDDSLQEGSVYSRYSPMARSYQDMAFEESEFLFDMIHGPSNPNLSMTSEQFNDGTGSRGPSSNRTLLDAAERLKAELESAVASTALDDRDLGLTSSPTHSFADTQAVYTAHARPNNLLTAAAHLGSELELVVGATDALDDEVFYAEPDVGRHALHTVPPVVGSTREQLLQAALQLSVDVEESVIATREC